MAKPSKNVVNVTAEVNKTVALLGLDIKKHKWVPYASKLLGAAGIIGNLICEGITIFGGSGGNDPGKMMMDKLDEISKQIDEMGNRIEVCIAQTSFCTNVKTPHYHLLNLVTEYIKKGDEKSFRLMKKEEGEPIRILNAMISILNCESNPFDVQLKKKKDGGEYTDAAFEELQTLYINIIKQLVFAYGVMENAINKRVDDQAEKCVGKIEEIIDKENDKRKQKYWTQEIIGPLIKHHMVHSTSNEAAAKDIYDTMEKRYGKTGYYFAAGVYDACSGFDTHCIKGTQYMHLFRVNDRNAFVIRNPLRSSYRDSKFIDTVAWSWPVPSHKPDNYWDLRPLAKNIYEKDESPAAVAVVRDYNGFRTRFHSFAFQEFNHRHTLTILVAKKPA